MKNSAPLEVVAAVIEQNKQIFCVRRGIHRYGYLSHKFEFPGGKIEAGESQEAALVREIREELGLSILPVQHLVSVQHQYPDFAILLHAWLCTADNSEPVLHEHIACCWLPPAQLSELDWAAADVPVVELLMDGIPPSGQRR